MNTTTWMTNRTEPYTKAGIKRLRCIRCGAKATAQWNVCADKGRYRPICTACDMDLNRLVLAWFKHPERERLMNEYAGAGTAI